MVVEPEPNLEIVRTNWIVLSKIALPTLFISHNLGPAVLVVNYCKFRDFLNLKILCHLALPSSKKKKKTFFYKTNIFANELFFYKMKIL